MSGYHAIASASKSDMWISCPNSLAANSDQPEGDKTSADLGTDKHELLAICFNSNTNACEYKCKVMGRGNRVDDEFIAHVQCVLDNVRQLIDVYALSGYSFEMFVEEKVDIEHITGEKDARGTADIIIIFRDLVGKSTLYVIDAKFGFQEVDAVENNQLTMYAAGVIHKFRFSEDFNRGFLRIEQPTRGNSLYKTSVSEIEDWVKKNGAKAKKALEIYAHKSDGLLESDFNPTVKGCERCKAKPLCPALFKKVEGLMTSLDSIETLADKFKMLPLVEDWVNSVKARARIELLSGKEVPGLKLIEGNRGIRKWSDPETVAELLKSLNADPARMYSRKLLGPKQILSFFYSNPEVVSLLESFVVRKNPELFVALEDDVRAPVQVNNLIDGFETED
jgi:hypothetical protein